MKDALHSELEEGDLIAEIDHSIGWACIGVIAGGQTPSGRARYLRLGTQIDENGNYYPETWKAHGRLHAIVKISADQAEVFFRDNNYGCDANSLMRHMLSIRAGLYKEKHEKTKKGI